MNHRSAKKLKTSFAGPKACLHLAPLVPFFPCCLVPPSAPLLRHPCYTNLPGIVFFTKLRSYDRLICLFSLRLDAG
ncbi:hypothetical protein BDV19DRAFT_369326 [Aspergillus venezuelensis]